MRRLLLALTLALGSASVAAQTAPDSLDAPARRVGVHAEAGQALLTVGVHAAVAYGLITVAGEDDYGEGGGAGDAVALALLLASPAIVGGVACGSGALLDLPGSCRRAFTGALLGAAPGMAIMAIGLAQSGGAWGGLGYVLVGGLAYLVVPPFAALEGYRHGARAVPGIAAVRGPDGEVTPVAALSVRF